MKFPKQYIKKGKFKLHSGKTTDTFYDVNEMLTDYEEWDKVKNAIAFKINNSPLLFVGIATGGAIIASKYSNCWSMIKDGEYKGAYYRDNNNEGMYDYCLIDDVVTTGKSIEEAIKIIGYKPKSIFAVVDRREDKRKMRIKSMYKV